MTATKYSCTGFNFSSFKADGSDIADINAQVYDATMALVYGILNATVQADGSYKIPDYISGLKVKSELVSKVAFEVRRTVSFVALLLLFILRLLHVIIATPLTSFRPIYYGRHLSIHYSLGSDRKSQFLAGRPRWFL
jgi:hypothetical protein